MKLNRNVVWHGFEAWKFQNACHCHGNRKNTQFNTKVNNNLLRLRNFKMATVAMEIIFNISIMFLHYSSFIPLVLVLFVWGTFVTLCVTVTNISSCLWYTQSRTIYTSLETNTLTIHHRYDFKVWIMNTVPT